MSKFYGLLPKTEFKTNQQKKKKLLDVKIPVLKIYKWELKTNETLILQVTNALFYKADKNRQQLAGCTSVPMQELIHE